MTQREFESWIQFYEESPFDEHHRYHRPAVLISQSMAGGDVQDKLDFLFPPRVSEDSVYSDADLKTFAAFGVKPPRV